MEKLPGIWNANGGGFVSYTDTLIGTHSFNQHNILNICGFNRYILLAAAYTGQQVLQQQFNIHNITYF